MLHQRPEGDARCFEEFINDTFWSANGDFSFIFLVTICLGSGVYTTFWIKAIYCQNYIGGKLMSYNFLCFEIHYIYLSI